MYKLQESTTNEQLIIKTITFNIFMYQTWLPIKNNHITNNGTAVIIVGDVRVANPKRNPEKTCLYQELGVWDNDTN
jgi:hypothetical protein